MSNTSNALANRLEFVLRDFVLGGLLARAQGVADRHGTEMEDGRMAFPSPHGAQVGRLAALALVLLLSACDDGSSGSESFVSRDHLPSGAVVVRSDPVDPDSPPEGWAVGELFRIGSAAGEDEATAFGFVRAVEVDDLGRVYALDSEAAVVRVFDRDGEHLRDIGGPGPGPGELGRDVTGMMIDHEDRLWLADRTYGRYTVFELDGTLVDTYRRDFTAGWRFFWDAAVTDDGMFYEPVTISRPSTDEDGSQAVFLGLTPTERGMEAVDTVPRPAPIEREFWSVGFVEVRPGVGQGGRWPIPFLPESHDRVDPRGGFWTGRTDAFRFALRAPEGDTLRIVERSAPAPPPVTEADRRRVLEEITERFGDDQDVDLDRMPERKPYWSSFFVDPEGRLWVERYEPAGGDDERMRTWEVYDPAGVYLGALDLPISATGMPTPAVRNGRLVGVVRDDLDVDHVVVFELRTGAP